MGRDRNAASWFRSLGYITLTCLCLLLLQSPRLFAQVDEGTITGVIQDPTGAVVPNAKVTLLSTDTGLTLEKSASGGGEYTFAPVKIGHYSVTASAPGFATTTQQNLQVNVNNILQVNIQLKPGSATQTVEVTATAPQLQTQDASGTNLLSTLAAEAVTGVLQVSDAEAGPAGGVVVVLLDDGFEEFAGAVEVVAAAGAGHERGEDCPSLEVLLGEIFG